MQNNSSPLSLERKKYAPKLPSVFKDGPLSVAIKQGPKTSSKKDQESIAKLFPHTYGAPLIDFVPGKSDSAPLTIGVVLSGGQAPGGHNVIAGLFDGVKAINKNSRLLGFLGGPSGLEKGKFTEITAEFMDSYRNTGGFDIIGSGRTKLETEEQFNRCIEVVKKNAIDGIIIIGGDDSNTNAAVLAEYFKEKNVPCSVNGCPKTIDGDLKNEYIETSFGFDTAAKTYAQLVSNIAKDANSAKKYWHFIKLMGRSASHITLEVALQSHPNITLISEEIAEKKYTLAQIVKQVADVVAKRAEQGKNFGIAVIPEGLIEFIPEMKTLISELNDTLAHHEKELEGLDKNQKIGKILTLVSPNSKTVLSSLPEAIQAQLLLDRDPHGNVQVSLIETERLLFEMVGTELKKRPSFKGSFKPMNHFFGYEGRCAEPSNFDADYTYGLGYTAAILTKNKLTGYMSSIRHLNQGIEKWTPCGIPVSMMMNIERRHGHEKPVIQKALVETDKAAFKFFAENREQWAMTESYRLPGPIQFYGPKELCDATTLTLAFGC